ncbi:MAG: alpha/beta hydrolase [Pontiellaceae bacterium]|nr:alpha/beta hydrolase [Pontiellaceae bacterium]
MTTYPILQRILIYGLLFIAFNIFAWFRSEQLLFCPQEPSYTHLPNEVKIPTADGGRITAVFLEQPDAQHTILFSHGNAEDLGKVVPFMQQFYAMGFSVLMYDYRGYGTSEGKASTAHVKQDAEAAYNWLVHEKGIQPRSIIIQGRSLGGGVAVWLASRNECGGLITEESFASAFRVKTHWKILPWDKFDSLRSIRRVDCPVLVIHGTDDRLIPLWHAEKVYNAAPEPKRALWIKGGQHNNYVYAAEEQYFGTVREFIDELGQK